MSKLAMMILIMLSGAVAHATVDRSDTSCENAMTTYEINDCVRTSYEAADKDLNIVYKKLVGDLTKAAVQEKKDDPRGIPYSSEILARLVKSQKAWITYRDTNCSLEATTMLNGSAETAHYLGCLERTTQERIQQLKQLQ